MRKGLIGKGAVLLTLAAGLILGTGTKAQADVIDPVEFYFMDGEQESPIIEIGTQLKTLVPSFGVNRLIYVDDEEIRTNTKRYVTYYSRAAGTEEWGNEQKRIELTANDKIQEGKDYKIHFTFKSTSTQDSFANPFQNKNCVYVYNDQTVPVCYAGHEDTSDGTKAKTVELELFTCNQGTGTVDMTQNSGRLVLSQTAADSWQRQQARVKALSISGTLNKAAAAGAVLAKTANGVTTYDLDKNGTDDLKFFVNDKNAWEFVVLSDNSVRGTWSYTVPANDRDKGVSALLIYYETLELKFKDPDPVDMKGAKVAAISEQTYTGSAITPAVTVTLDGKTLVSGTDYTVSYSNNVNEGTATVTVTGKGAYTGTATTTFVIKKAAQQGQQGQQDQQSQPGTTTPGTTTPGTSDGKDDVEIDKIVLRKVTIKSCKAKSGKKIALKWKEVDEADGYEIAYSTDKKFKKSVKTKKTEKKSITLKSLKKGKVYYVRVRAYVKEDGKTITGKWSAAKRVKVKK